MGRERNILVYLEKKSGGVSSASLGLLSLARRLADGLDCRLHAIAPCPVDSQPYADSSFEIRSETGAGEFPGLLARVISEFVRENKPLLLLFLGDQENHELAARVAAGAGAGLAARCTALRCDAGGSITAAREVYGGRLSQILRLDADHTTVVSVLPESIESHDPVDSEKTARPKAINVNTTEEDRRVRLVESEVQAAEDMDIAEADVLVSGGRGLKIKEGFALLRELADMLDGTVAGTRGAVDLEWLPRERQVGQTGKTVAPELYLACGLSGAPQHLQGMKNSRRIAAINTDPNAPIIRIADFAVIGDLFKIIPELTRRIHAGQS
ncbi:MAG: electron transfer flavoprotein subunit alpha/FixB family protein [Planctomycetota bacterium]